MAARHPCPPARRSAENGAPLRSLRLTALALALRALPAGFALIGLAASSFAHAAGDAPAAAGRKVYAVPAGALGAALAEFGGQAGVTVQVDSRIVAGRRTSGLSGAYTVREGFAALLAGTGLEIVDEGTGVFLVRRRLATGPDGTPTTLPEVSVLGAAVDATTEGSGSYAANAVTMFGNTQSLKDIPSSVSVLTRQQMDDQNITTIRDAMRYSTGIASINYTGNSSSSSGATAYYNARGFPVNVSLDGLSILNGIQYSTLFDMAMYDRVEVFRGPAGLLDGQGSLGGSVNLVSKRPTDTLQLKSETSIGSWADYRQMIDVSGPLNAAGTLRGRVVGVAAKANSFLDGEHSREGMGYAVLEYDITPRTTFSVSAGYQDTPTYETDWGVGYDTAGQVVRGPRGRSQNFAPDWSYSFNTIQEGKAALTHRFDSGWKAEAAVLSRENRTHAKYAFALQPDGATRTADYFGQNQLIDDDWLATDVRVSGPITILGRRNDVLLGANYTTFHQRFRGGSEDLGTYDIFKVDIPEPAMPYTSGTRQRVGQFSLYGHVNSHLTDDLSLVLGGREMYFRQQSKTTMPAGGDWTTTAKENGKFVPYGGLVFAITPQVSAYTSYSKIFSVQTDTTASGGAIAPFTGEQYEVGLKGSFLENRLNATLAAFRINGDHLAVADQAHPGFSAASGAVRSQGWEAELSGEPLPNWNVVAGYTLTNTRYTSSPTDQGASYDGETPRHLFKLWNTYRFTQAPLQGLSVGAGMYVQSNTYRLSPQYHQAGYAIYSAKVGYQFNSHLSADVTVNNLFDKRYYSRAPASLFAEYGAPRSVMLTVRASY
ncbi:hypothetical protein CAL29_00390 [Bordetella genomosp. 10]|uniref:Secretin/TonB short N-terminal domain-containing protein n=1 Tax=Bordetella genomosp. 10 TaxID=1416804 RepID=A0A261SHN1_9BORD|nr:TonB-dependent receptor [Bordetella genomosp. 10]OZI36939.1 hypothetical protein CAL29_00390 [Bordetella genomosp. 10]